MDSSDRSNRGHANHRRTRTASASVGVVTLGVVLLQACSFTAGFVDDPQAVYDTLDRSQYVEPTGGERWTVIDDARLRVEHGWTCAEAPNAASTEYVGLRVADFTPLPSGFDGTVFLNGWHVEYERRDHHVTGYGTSIFNVAQLNDVLVWNAGGVISDKNGDDPYRWCYRYTTVAWKRPATGPFASPLQPRIDMRAFHADPQATLIGVDTATEGGLATIPGVFKTSGKPPRGVLLAGFGSTYTDTDHHVLQMAFDLRRPRIRRQRIRWKAQAILKDDNADDPSRSAAIVSVLSGDSVEFFRPAAATSPTEDVANALDLVPRNENPGFGSACLGAPASKTVELAISTPPYSFAVPMLTGWEVQSNCFDEHVTHAGAWIESWRYERQAGASNGTLYVTVATNFGDRDGFPGMASRTQVEVLGINVLQPVIGG